MRKYLRVCAVSLLLAGCASSTVGNEADAGPPPPDDGGAPSPVRESREIVSGGARVTGGTVTADVEVGHAMGQQRMTGGTLTVEGAAVVKQKPRGGREIEP